MLFRSGEICIDSENLVQINVTNNQNSSDINGDQNIGGMVGHLDKSNALETVEMDFSNNINTGNISGNDSFDEVMGFVTEMVA